MITANILFYVICALLISHELDAVHKREWRLLYILRKMPEEKARATFILLHVPLIAILLWLGTNTNETTRFWTLTGIDSFVVIHAILHWRLRKHPLNIFNTFESNLLIYGAAVLALLHLIFWFSLI